MQAPQSWRATMGNALRVHNSTERRNPPDERHATVGGHNDVCEVLRRAELQTTTAPGERPRVRGIIQAPHRGGRIRLRALRSDQSEVKNVPT